jgi:hypothetical protein
LKATATEVSYPETRYGGQLSSVPGHPLALMLTTLLADTARNVSSVRPMLEVVKSGRGQGGLYRG